MTDQASVAASSLLSQAVLMRERNGGMKPDGKVVPLPIAGAELAASAVAQGRDWSSAVELVKEASEAIRLANERNGELEAGLNEVLGEAAQEIEVLKEELRTGARELAQAQERAREAERRAGEAERRAAEAEAWLCRLHDTVVNAFAPLLRQTAATEPPEPAHPTEAVG